MFSSYEHFSSVGITEKSDFCKLCTWAGEQLDVYSLYPSCAIENKG